MTQWRQPPWSVTLQKPKFSKFTNLCPIHTRNYKFASWDAKSLKPILLVLSGLVLFFGIWFSALFTTFWSSAGRDRRMSEIQFVARYQWNCWFFSSSSPASPQKVGPFVTNRAFSPSLTATFSSCSLANPDEKPTCQQELLRARESWEIMRVFTLRES